MNEQQQTQAAIDEATLAQLEQDPAFQEVPQAVDLEEGMEEEQEQEQVLPPTKDLIMPICDLATKVFCPNWDIQPQEVDGLAEAYAAVIDKYFPNAASHMGVELNALLITAAIFGPRLASGVPPRPIKREKDQEQESVISEQEQQPAES